MPGLKGWREIDLKVYTSYQFREGVGEKKQTLVQKRIAYLDTTITNTTS